MFHTGITRILHGFTSLHANVLLSEARRSICTTPVLLKRRHPNRPILRHPAWHVRQDRANYPQRLTAENQKFITEVVHETYGPPRTIGKVEVLDSPLKDVPKIEPLEYRHGLRRTGTIARKIGVQILWLKNGSFITTTLLQIVDNHVIKYSPPGQFPLKRHKRILIRLKNRMKFGALIVGAESVDPQGLTKEYCGLFSKVGLAPKRKLTRFLISPSEVLPPGTPLDVNHYRIGEHVDVVGRSILRGFLGVVKRWGFRGQPASHGQTKTHRRPGNIGGGGEKGRVWPGKKLPGHKGGRQRVARGLKIWRINRKYNVIWVSGQAVPGPHNSFVYIHDSLLFTKRPAVPLPHPTYIPKSGEVLPEEEFAPEVHNPNDDTITFAITKDEVVRSTAAKTAKVRK